MKICNTCKQELPLDRFYKNKTSRDGYQHHCKDCTRIKMREWRAKNPERARTHTKKYRESERGRENRVEYREKNRERHRELHRVRRYGLIPEWFEKIEELQGGCCMICQKKPEVLHVDHCHATGGVRGLLCDLCNRGIGFFRDDVRLLERAIVYLRLSRGENADEVLSKHAEVL